MSKAVQKSDHLCSNCTFGTTLANSHLGHCHSNALARCDRCAACLWSAHIFGSNSHHESVCVHVCVSIPYGLMTSMLLTLIPPMLLMKGPTLARILIPCLQIVKCCIYLTIAIKVAVMLTTHLTQSIMTAVLCSYIPRSILFINYMNEALILLIIYDP